eukprot:3930729-Rhodomonas_salina.3
MAIQATEQASMAYGFGGGRRPSLMQRCKDAKMQRCKDSSEHHHEHDVLSIPLPPSELTAVPFTIQRSPIVIITIITATVKAADPVMIGCNCIP